jgi:hypothetical protein
MFYLNFIRFYQSCSQCSLLNGRKINEIHDNNVIGSITICPRDFCESEIGGTDFRSEKSFKI